MKLVVGLGNPGKEHTANRHNVGFRWLERLASAERVMLKAEARFHALLGQLDREGEECWLMQPQTFVNASGRAVRALAEFYKIPATEILVVHDELDLPPGVARLKQGGGVSGHNGLKDIAAHLGTQDFWRLRIGIGHPGEKALVVDYVLDRPPAGEKKLIEQAIHQSLEIWPLIAENKHQAAMLKLHTKQIQ
ncbi:MAG TPA: aminoacyl-tRNA hydrolase [Burkholderiales bacterium]|nr:aminoacyl-tRNA hydrolase [Burkholderiales bacterium]